MKNYNWLKYSWLAAIPFAFIGRMMPQSLPPIQIELACPNGTTVVSGGQTLNSSTGKYRQYKCVDASGNIKHSAITIDYTSNTIGGLTIANTNNSGGNQVTGVLWSVTASGDIRPNNLILNHTVNTPGSGEIAFGNNTGFGNGTPATAVTTTTLGTGSGPTTPQTITNYLEIKTNSAIFWIPLVQ